MGNPAGGTADGEGHGLVVWFETTLCEGVEYSTEPSDRRPTYSRLFLPFTEPLGVESGASYTCRVAASLLEGDWAWDWSVRGDGVRRSGSSLDALPSLMAPTDEPGRRVQRLL